MDNGYCRVCLKNFSEEIQAKKLPCEHSFCTSCVSQLIETTQFCPTCDMKLNDSDAHNLAGVDLTSSQNVLNSTVFTLTSAGSADKIISHNDQHASTEGTLTSSQNSSVRSLIGAALNISINDKFSVIDPFHETSKEVPDSPGMVKELRYRLEAFNEVHQQNLASAEEAIRKIMSQKEKVEKMKENETKILELISIKDEDLKVKEVSETLNDMEQLMKEVESSLSGQSHTKCDVHIALRHFETSRDFLSKIYNEIHNGVKLATCKTINGEAKFSEISIRDTTLFVHAFGSLQVPDTNAKLIEFEDLKEAFLERSLRVFFDFTSLSGLCQRVFIECYDHSVFTYYFLKLCTGETGSSYLGCPLLRKNGGHGDAGCVVSVDHFQTKLEYVDKYQERLCKNSEVFGCLEKKKQYFVSFLLTGSFEVIRCESEKMYPNVIGTAENDETQKLLSEKSFNKVLNCGIALTLNF